MSTIFHLPDLGEGLPDAEINQWHVKVGDKIKTDDLLVSMETAKAVVDVPSPQTGIIGKLYGKEGDIIKTGEPLMEFVAEGAKPATAPAAESPQPSAETSQNTKANAKCENAATVAGAIEVGDEVLEESATGITPTTAVKHNIKAMPSVRALARRLNVDLTAVQATGNKGRITADDVHRAAQSNSELASALPAMPTAPIITEASGQLQNHALTAEIIPLRGVRRAMANAMAKSHAEVVPVTLVDDADIQAWPAKTDITWRVIRAITKACHVEPALNAHFDFGKLERKVFAEVNIGIAMDSPDGLFVPVITSAQKLDQSRFRAIMNRLKLQVRERSVPQEELTGSTIQLSNFGTFAGRYANPVIVPPNVAIVGTGKIRQEVVAVNNAIAIHRVMPISLSVDHRAITGGEAARFLKAVIDDLQLAN